MTFYPSFNNRNRSRNKLRATGDPAPRFELKDADGAVVRLEDLIAKGPVLVAFFKISCPVCQLTFPYLERLSKTSGLQVVGISQDDARDTGEFNKRFGVTFPTLGDPRAHGYPVSSAYGITNVPTLFLVEPDGILSMVVNGFSKRDLESLGRRIGVQTFAAGERVPDFRPG